MEMDTLSFAQVLRDATCYELRQTDDGKEFLDKCWIYQQTKPDRAALRNKYSNK